VLIPKAHKATLVAAALEMFCCGKNLFHLSAIGPSMNQASTAAFTYFANHAEAGTSANHASAASVEIQAADTRVLTNSALFIVAAGLKEDLDQSNTSASAKAVT
jgi:hypothetical protein